MKHDDLISKGVVFLDADSVYIAPEVDRDRIHAGAVIHPGCRILGAETSIGPDCVIGAESPVTLKNCQLGKGVKICGGFVDGTTLLDGASAGDGFHCRPGSLLEEKSSVAHTVGLKQTILMPYVTLGSLINFCDVLMAGGTSSKDHSEVGSSYIHFNFTPHQDKATASLVGDVSRGVFLDQPAIFLGGQGGMVGPCRIAYGTVIAAGLVTRRNVLEENQLITGGDNSGMRARPYNAKLYGKIDTIVETGMMYFENIIALKAWYTHVRKPMLSKTPWGAACVAGGLQRIDEVWKERMKRFDQLATKLQASVDAAGSRASSMIYVAQQKFVDAWPEMKSKLNAAFSAEQNVSDEARAVIEKVAEQENYISAIQGLTAEEKAALRGCFARIK